MVLSELIEELKAAEKKGANRVECSHAYICEVTCDGVGCYIDLKVSKICGLTLSELIKELQSMRVGYGGDVEVACMEYEIPYTEVILNKCYIKYNVGKLIQRK